MSEPVLKIEPKKYTGKTLIVSIRAAGDLVQEVDRVAALTGRTRNEIMNLSLEFALKHMQIPLREEPEKDGKAGDPL